MRQIGPSLVSVIVLNCPNWQ